MVQARRITQDYLHRAALYYLERYDSSTENLRRVLMRKVQRATQVHADTDPVAAAGWIAELIARLTATGVLDDQRYMENRAASLARRGESRRGIGARLAAKGIKTDHLAETLADHDDLAAAIALARRRRLGPFRPQADRLARRDRDLAALARKGFDRRTAVKVIDAASVDDLMQLANQSGD